MNCLTKLFLATFILLLTMSESASQEWEYYCSTNKVIDLLDRGTYLTIATERGVIKNGQIIGKNTSSL